MIGRIYLLRCKDTSKFYIGSTIHNLTYRLKKHRSTSKEVAKMNSPLYTHFREIGWDKAEMSLIHEIHVENRRQLLELEKIEILKHIEDDLCLNHNRPIITQEEKKHSDKEYAKMHRIENKDRERTRLQEWRKNNPEKRKEQVRRANERAKEKKQSK